MASVYKILKEFTADPDPDSITVAPFWVMAVIRFAQPLTFSRKRLFSGETATSYDANAESLIRERPMVAISDDVLQMSITHTKGSYVSSLSATLMNGNLNYLSEIQPNDWVFAWILNSEEKGRLLMDRIFKEGEACNAFDDGLKFVGRVQSIRKNLQQDPNTGLRMVRYQLNAAGFKELDSSIFYDPALAREEQSIGQFLTELGIGLDEIWTDATKSALGISTTKVIPRLLKLLVGEGIPTTSATFGPVQQATGLTNTKEAPYAYAIPTSAAKLLGQANESKRVPAYADILELVIGLQKYQAEIDGTPQALFTPAGADSASNHRVLNDKLLGTFQPLPITLSGKSVWSIMEEFKNPAVNEMFTSLRVNPDGKVVPTLTVRQLPFSTDFAMQSSDTENLTGFLELPRWFCDPILVNSLDIGKTDALHMNFIHVYGQASAENGVSLTEQLIQNPPIRDEQDIKRSGLRAHMQTVACSIDDTLEEPKKWMKIIADFMIGQQYTLNGTVNMIGISAPICPGDNFEFDDTVYHIEAVTHNCSMSGSMRQFNTSLSLSHGMRTDTPVDKEPHSMKTNTGQELVGLNSELLLYTGVQAGDNLGHDPGQTLDTRTTKQIATQNANAGIFSQDDEGSLV